MQHFLFTLNGWAGQSNQMDVTLNKWFLSQQWVDSRVRGWSEYRFCHSIPSRLRTSSAASISILPPNTSTLQHRETSNSPKFWGKLNLKIIKGEVLQCFWGSTQCTTKTCFALICLSNSFWWASFRMSQRLERFVDWRLNTGNLLVLRDITVAVANDCKQTICLHGDASEKKNIQHHL